MSAPALVTRGLKMRFGDVEALRGVELRIDGPGVFGFLGRNGAGKSTTMQLVNGFFRPSEGAIEVFGEPVGPGRVGPKRRIGYLQQSPAFYDWMTGAEELAYHGALVGLSPKKAREEGEALAKELGIHDALSRRVTGYSGGMKQRLGLARALLGGPDLLLLDEPVSALDPVGRAELLSLVRRLGERATVFMSTHILADVERVADRVTVIEQGRIVLDEPLAALRRRHLRPLLVVELRAPVPDAFQAALSEAPWLAELHSLEAEKSQWSSPEEPPSVRFRLEVHDAEAAARELPRLVAEHELRLVRLTPVEATLEETFLSLVEAKP